MKLKFLEREYWYGGYVIDGANMPINSNRNQEIDCRVNYSTNQLAPLFVSSKGRYIWREKGFLIKFEQGIIDCPDDVVFKEGFKNLKGAYLAAMREHFPFNGRMVSVK